MSDEQTRRRSLLVDTAKEMAKNFAMVLPPVRTWRLKRSRAEPYFTGADADLDRYAFQTVRSLTKLLGSLSGLRILEIGPGDFLTSGLSLLAAGAASYTAIDRFPGDHSGVAAKEWYHGIAAAWPRFFPDTPWPKGLQSESFPEAYPERIKVIRSPIEDVRADRRYDVICSYQVGEHVQDIQALARSTASLLAPGGIGLHRVDFGPHDCWTLYPDPLTFLHFPDWLWRIMGSNRGTPNRRRHHEFCSAFEDAGLHVSVDGLEYFPTERVDLGHLARRFRQMPRESLLVRTALYLCRL